MTKDSASDPDKQSFAQVFDPAEWERRVAEARARRERVLASRKPAAGEPKGARVIGFDAAASSITPPAKETAPPGLGASAPAALPRAGGPATSAQAPGEFGKVTGSLADRLTLVTRDARLKRDAAVLPENPAPAEPHDVEETDGPDAPVLQSGRVALGHQTAPGRRSDGRQTGTHRSKLRILLALCLIVALVMALVGMTRGTETMRFLRLLGPSGSEGSEQSSSPVTSQQGSGSLGSIPHEAASSQPVQANPASALEATRHVSETAAPQVHRAAFRAAQADTQTPATAPKVVEALPGLPHLAEAAGDATTHPVKSAQIFAEATAPVLAALEAAPLQQTALPAPPRAIAPPPTPISAVPEQPAEPILEASEPEETAETDPVDATPLPASAMRVFVHAPLSEPQARIDAAVSALVAAGYPPQAIVRTNLTVTASNVRFFYAPDSSHAQAVGSALARALPGSADVRDFTFLETPAEPGLVEVWLSGGPAGSAPWSPAIGASTTPASDTTPTLVSEPFLR